MKPTQPRLLPDPRPLVEKLGREFFRALPRGPCVYLMRGADGSILYVGKAKSLRHRLGSYRVANPERMPRRILRLVHRGESIVWEECASEATALAREAELLLELRPKFNRAGVWKPPQQEVAWRELPDGIELAVVGALSEPWRCLARLRARPVGFLQALARLAWCRMRPESGIVGMPCGWWRGRECAVVRVPGNTAAFLELLDQLMSEGAVEMGERFAQAALAEDVDFVRKRLLREAVTSR